VIVVVIVVMDGFRIMHVIGIEALQVIGQGMAAFLVGVLGHRAGFRAGWPCGLQLR